MKVIHLPTTVGGNPQGISRHLNQLGVKSETWTIRQNYFGYPADKVLSHSDNLLLIELKKILALRYVFRCDIAFFNFGSGIYQPFFNVDRLKYSRWIRPVVWTYCAYTSLMAKVEITLLDWLKIPVFIQYQGDDARQGDYSKVNFKINFVDRVGPFYYTKASDEMKRKQISLFSKFATKIYALNPDLLHVLPSQAEFLPYSHINLTEWSPVYTQMNDRPLRIGHAPSHRGVKGTDLVVTAVEKLKQAGFDFEFTLVEGYSHSEAKEIYKDIDILVDQFFAGWYGGLAVEAMALGKPVIAYLREEDLHFIPDAMRQDMPIIKTRPETIYNTLVHLLTIPRTELLSFAKQSRAYVEKWHNPVTIAQRIKADMESALGEH